MRLLGGITHQPGLCVPVGHHVHFIDREIEPLHLGDSSGGLSHV